MSKIARGIPHEPSGFRKDVGRALSKVAEIFTKPLAAVSKAITERLALRFRRKPELHVHFHPTTGLWCLASQGGKKIMQVGFVADFTHDDPRQTIILVDAFPEGTRSELQLFDYITIPPEERIRVRHHLWRMVTPVVGEEGKNWKGRIVLVDQWKRKYTSKEFEFIWVGGKGTAAPSASTPTPTPP